MTEKHICSNLHVFYSYRIFKRPAKALISLHVCAGWSEPLMVAHTTLLEISCHGSFVLICMCPQGVKFSRAGPKLIWASTQEYLSSEFVNNKSADQPALMRSLICTFVICVLESIISKLVTSEPWVFQLVYVVDRLPVKYFTDHSKAVLLLWIFYVFSVLCLLCLCARLFICALWSPAGKGLTSWLSFVVYNYEFVAFPLVSWVRCGTWLYRFLIFAPLLTLHNYMGENFSGIPEFRRADLLALVCGV